MHAIGHRFTDITDKDTGEKKHYTKLFCLEPAATSDEGGQVPIEVTCDLEARASLTELSKSYPCEIIVTKSRIEQKKTGSGARVVNLIVQAVEVEE